MDGLPEERHASWPAACSIGNLYELSSNDGQLLPIKKGECKGAMIQVNSREIKINICLACCLWAFSLDWSFTHIEAYLSEPWSDCSKQNHHQAHKQGTSPKESSPV